MEDVTQLDEVRSLTKDDQLKHYERIIEEGLETFVQVGDALLAIKENKLYQRKGYKTFEQYCQQQWDIGRSTAYQLTDAAQTMQNLSSMADRLPQNERQARPLAPLKNEPEVQRQAWQEAVQTAPNGEVTGRHVEEVVRKYLPPAAAPAAGTHLGVAAAEIKPLGGNDQKHAVHFSSETAEHWTPRHIVERVVYVLGQIDLDPCSNSKETPNVPAARHFTMEDDGLSQWWAGNVFMNPPYGDEIGQWVDKLCAEYDAGGVRSAIALVPGRTDTEWFRQLTEGGPLICFVHGRLRFIGSDGVAQGSAPFPSVLVYFGEDGLRFYQAFNDIGRILQEVTVE